MNTELNKHDLNFALRRMPGALRRLMLSEFWRGKVFVGGGFLRSVVSNEPVNDVDVFVTSKDDAMLVAKLLVFDQFKRTVPLVADTEARERFLKAHIYETDNALTLRHFSPTVQIIHRWTFSRIEDIIKSFDFTVCCAAIRVKSDGEWEGRAHERFYPDLAAKRLVYLSPIREEEPGGSMLRVLKYYQKGYRMPLDSLAAVMARMFLAVDWNKALHHPDEVPQLLTSMLRAVDPLVDLTHEAHLPAENALDKDIEEDNA
jgi:hypothetical protein